MDQPSTSLESLRQTVKCIQKESIDAVPVGMQHIIIIVSFTKEDTLFTQATFFFYIYSVLQRRYTIIHASMPGLRSCRLHIETTLCRCHKDNVSGKYASMLFHEFFVLNGAVPTKPNLLPPPLTQNIHRYQANKNNVNHHHNTKQNSPEFSNEKLWPALQERLKTTFVKETW